MEVIALGYWLSGIVLHGLYEFSTILSLKEPTSDHCQEFLSHFRELSTDFENHYEVSLAGTALDAASWPALIDRARKLTVELRLSAKKYCLWESLLWMRLNIHRSIGDSVVISVSDSSDSTLSGEVCGSSDPEDLIPNGKTSTKSTRSVPLGPRVSTDKGSAKRGRFGEPSGPSSKTTLAASLSESSKNDLETLNRFHVFPWFAAIPNDESINTGNKRKATQEFVTDWIVVEDTLTDMHSYLCTSQFKKHREYKRCPGSTVGDVEATLARLILEEHNTRPRPTRKSRRRHRRRSPSIYDRGSRERRSREESHSESERSIGSYERYEKVRREKARILEHAKHGIFTRKRKKFIRTLKTMFELFLPLDHTADMVSKYWGAIYILLQVWSFLQLQ